MRPQGGHRQVTHWVSAVEPAWARCSLAGVRGACHSDEAIMRAWPSSACPVSWVRAGALGSGAMGQGPSGQGPSGQGPSGRGPRVGALGSGALGSGALGSGALGSGAQRHDGLRPGGPGPGPMGRRTRCIRDRPRSGPQPGGSGRTRWSAVVAGPAATKPRVRQAAYAEPTHGKYRRRHHGRAGRRDHVRGELRNRAAGGGWVARAERLLTGDDDPLSGWTWMTKAD